MIGWITTWDIRCGIATYSQFLTDAIDEEIVILCQKGEGESETENVFPCWKRDSNDFGRLLAIISSNEIDKIVIQHQPGLMRFSYLNELLLIFNRMELDVFITMHNTQDRSLIYPSKRIERAVEGLKTCSKVMVHSNNDVKNLEKLGISENVVMIPHGIYPPPNKDVKSLPVKGRTMATFGFLFPHKGHLQLIEAFSRLPGWDELLVLSAVREGSGKMLTKCENLISKLELKGKVRMVTDFLDDEVAIATLSKCELLVFPYQNTKESASGAVRMGVASGAALAVTPIPIFDDIEGAIRLPGISVDYLVKGISEASDSDLEQSRKAMTKLRDSLQWSEIASRIQALF